MTVRILAAPMPSHEERSLFLLLCRQIFSRTRTSSEPARDSLYSNCSDKFNLFSPAECNFCYLLHVRSTLDLFILFIVVFSHFRPRDGIPWDVRLDQQNYLESGLFGRYEFCRKFVLFNLLFNISVAIL